jgi:glycosyltransferase involved in cell wall biosynthesis
MDSKKVAIGQNVDGVVWWRFWNPMSMLGDWVYHHIEGTIDQEKFWYEVFDGVPIKHLWHAAHAPVGRQIAEECRNTFKAPIVTEIDDDYWNVPKYNPSYKKLQSYLLKEIEAMHEQADRICCSTPYLVDKMGPKAGLAPNFIVPDSWDHPARKTKSDDECVAILTGGLGRGKEFDSIKEALIKFLAEPNTKLVVMGAFHEFLLDYPPGKVIWSRWSEVWDYPKLLRLISPDIVISPLEHNDFNRAKSNIKWLESAMVDACFVGERWGELERTIVDGETGHLCDGIDEWTEKLVSLARDREVRLRTSQRAKDVVLSDWTWDAVGADWRAALGV